MRLAGYLVSLLGLSLACSGARSAESPPASAQPRAAQLERPRAAPPLSSAEREKRTADARHLLGRFAFGPRPGEAARVAELGAERWLRGQLELPAENAELARVLAPHQGALAPPVDLVSGWLGEGWGDEADDLRELREQMKPHFKEHLQHLSCAKLASHIVSERQVQEVMVDFWVNHFNVFAPKGFVRVFAGDYVERALRPHALGRFSDLLLHAARHPAMLIYLDNVDSVAPPAMANEAGPLVAQRARKATKDKPKPKKRGGLNENFARELLELHTLGVDAGYTQDDVVSVARVLTGWGVLRKGGKLEYEFREKRHDHGDKRVLGRTFAAAGEREGHELLLFLANHPATARHLAHKLCARFVSDQPPAECVEQAAKAYLESGGEIAKVLLAIVGHESFWDPAVRGAKLKSPVELVVSAARALGARPDGKVELADALERLGEPALQERVPTGYPDAAAGWTSSGNLLSRMNFAAKLASGTLPGLSFDAERALPANLEPKQLVHAAGELLLGQHANPQTLDVVERKLAGLDDPLQRRSLALALLLGSPEFQRQ